MKYAFAWGKMLIAAFMTVMLTACLCSCTGTQQHDPFSQISTTVEIPEKMFRITGQLSPLASLEEQHDAINRLALAFDCQPLLDQGKTYGSGKTQYPTATGGAIQYNRYSAFYLESPTSVCAAEESQGTAERIAVLDWPSEEAENAGYTLGDNYSVSSAVEYAESLFNQSLALYSTLPDARVGKVVVYQLQDESYRFVLLFDRYIDGLAIEQYSTFAQITSESGGFRKSFIVMEMDAPDHICHYCDYYSFRVLEMEPVESIMSQEDAQARVKEVLAKYTDYTVREVSLKYGCFLNSQPESIEAQEAQLYYYQPYWCFVLEWFDYTNSPDNYIPNVTLFIDAQAGTAYLLDSISYKELQIAE